MRVAIKERTLRCVQIPPSGGARSAGGRRFRRKADRGGGTVNDDGRRRCPPGLVGSVLISRCFARRETKPLSTKSPFPVGARGLYNTRQIASRQRAVEAFRGTPQSEHADRIERRRDRPRNQSTKQNRWKARYQLADCASRSATSLRYSSHSDSGIFRLFIACSIESFRLSIKLTRASALPCLRPFFMPRFSTKSL